jgi:anti-anti-sigma factor
MPNLKPFTVLHSETGIDVVLLRGEIDHHDGAPRLDKTLERLKDKRATKVLLDFRDVTYCCSAGIASILDAAETLRTWSGVLVCAAVSGSAREPMDLLNIPDVISFFDAVSEAFDALEHGTVSAFPLN